MTESKHGKYNSKQKERKKNQEGLGRNTGGLIKKNNIRRTGSKHGRSDSKKT